MPTLSLRRLFFLLVVTLGVYYLVWLYRSTKALRNKGEHVPHFGLVFVPFVNFYWLWCYAKALDKGTHGQINGTLSFVLLIFVDSLALFFLQHQINAFERTAAQA